MGCTGGSCKLLQDQCYSHNLIACLMYQMCNCTNAYEYTLGIALVVFICYITGRVSTYLHRNVEDSPQSCATIKFVIRDSSESTEERERESRETSRRRLLAAIRRSTRNEISKRNVGTQTGEDESGCDCGYHWMGQEGDIPWDEKTDGDINLTEPKQD